MPDVGLLPEGFVPATIIEIRDELDEGWREKFGRSLPLGDATLLGHVDGILAERLGLLWEVGEAVNASQDRNSATGVPLRAVCALTGTFEQLASSSTVTEALCGDDGTVVPAESIISVESTGKKFETFEDATIVALDAWVAATPYAVRDRVTNADRCYQCIADGVSDGAGGPTTTDDDIVDNTVHWIYLGEGTAAVDVVCTAEETGPIEALSGDLTVIETPAAGWSSARNIEDAEPGRDAMSDEELRLLAEAELAQPGTGTPDAIRAALLDLDGVTNATVFFNNTDLTDADGLPPHTTECLIQGGVDQDIWQCLWDNVPVGIRTIGGEVGTVVDDEGFDQTLKFSRPTEIEIYIIVDLVEDPKTYGGDATVKSAIITWGDAQKTGKDAVASAISAQCFRVLGVLDVTSVKLGTAPAPGTSVTVDITLRQLAKYDTSRITINTTDGVP